MANSIDESYFIELAEKNPEDVCRLALCDYDPEKKGIRYLFGVEITVSIRMSLK